jgi:hypothetical protein
LAIGVLFSWDEFSKGKSRREERETEENMACLQREAWTESSTASSDKREVAEDSAPRSNRKEEAKRRPERVLGAILSDDDARRKDSAFEGHGRGLHPQDCEAEAAEKAGDLHAAEIQFIDAKRYMVLGLWSASGASSPRYSFGKRRPQFSPEYVWTLRGVSRGSTPVDERQEVEV